MNPRLDLMPVFLAVCIGLALGAFAWADPPADLALADVATLTSAIGLAAPGDGSDRLFVVRQFGQIDIIDLSTDTVLGAPFLTLAVTSGGERGLLGLAFHPGFPAEGRFYVYYTYTNVSQLRSRVSEFSVSADPNIADAASERILLEFAQNGSNHNGGSLAFGPDDFLYIGVGDGGGQYDPDALAQDVGALLGKVLRIDVDGTPPAQPNDLCGLVTDYGIPAGNPFSGGSGDCDEIWLVGFRNPWRLSFDRAYGDLFIGDVGQDQIEEIDIHHTADPGGGNFGWSCMEGTFVRNYNPCRPEPLIDPILEYAHSVAGTDNCSVTGGYRYRGPIPGLGGSYVYGDYCSGRIWIATETGASWSTAEWSEIGFGLTSFGEDDDGRLYVIDGSTVKRFTSPSSVFGDGFEFGDASPWSVAAGGS